MMSDVDVFRPGVLNIVAAKSYGTLVVTVQRDAICHGGVFRDSKDLYFSVLGRYRKTRLTASRFFKSIDKLSCFDALAALARISSKSDFLLTKSLFWLQTCLVFQHITLLIKASPYKSHFASNIMALSGGGINSHSFQSIKFMDFLLHGLENSSLQVAARLGKFFGSTLASTEL
ncbi:hypothetical protein Tco_0875892 [Tanacetum coccineum]|uniref:Uncharacterized protein n=1 Tax=Tanacetum coccineum TaxID=301880 RepID=A0ABQ5BR37_9ASTR